MATTVSMPQLGETVTEGTILRWAGQVGDPITEDDILLEVSTDKVDTEIPSPISGVILEILAAEGQTVEVGADLAVIGEPDEESATQTESSRDVDATEPKLPSETDPPDATPATLKVIAADPVASGAKDRLVEVPPEETLTLTSPIVRRLIEDHGLDVSQISGTGQGGRIRRDDVEAHITARANTPPAADASTDPLESPQAEPAAEDLKSDAVPFLESPSSPPPAPTSTTGSADEIRELSRLRVRIAENNLNAIRTAAHVWTSVEVDFERVERARRKHKDQFKTTEGFSLTYLPFISRATIDALKAYPVVNSSFDLESRTSTYHRTIELGIAIDLQQEGLIVARVHEAEALRLIGIAREIASLADRGRGGTLSVDDMSASTFTITNPGPFGSFMSAPIINVPNVAILSTDAIAKRPTVVTTADGVDTLAIRHIGYLGLSWDHRAFDGSTAVLFLRHIKEIIEGRDWEQELR